MFVFFCLSSSRETNGTGEDGPLHLKALKSFTLDCNPILVLFFTGNCVDSLNYNRGATFSTKDKDSDNRPSSNCAVDHQGAWWYKSCTQTNLNGLYNLTGLSITGIYWYRTLQNKTVLLKRVEMKLELVE